MGLSSTFLFKSLSESQLQSLMKASKEVQIQKGQWLFQEGEAADRVYILKSGAIEMLTTVDDKFELPIKIIRSQWGCFGISSLVPPYEYSLSSRCVEDAVLIVFQREDLQHLTREDSTIECTMMTNLAQHLLARLKETRQEVKIHFKTLFRSMHS